MREQALRLAGSPRIEPSDEPATGELAYVATFEVVPDFGDIDVSKLNVVRHTAEVTDADIDRMIENLRLQRRSWQPVHARRAGRATRVDAGDLVAGRRRAPAGRRRREAARP